MSGKLVLSSLLRLRARSLSVARSLARSVFKVERFYDYVLGYSRFSHIPLCNISANHGDMATTVADVQLGRLLKNNNYVLWGSPGRRSDMGTTDQVLAFECDELQNPDINYTGSYKTYCVTMQLQTFPVTAVVHAKDIEDVSTAGSGQDDFTEELSRKIASGVIPLASTLVDETTFCLEPFKILAYMAGNWVRDAQVLNVKKREHGSLCLSMIRDTIVIIRAT